MRGLRKAAPAIVGAAVVALTLGACGGSSDSGSGGGGDGAAYVTVNGSEPQNPLVPANTIRPVVATSSTTCSRCW